MYKTIRFYKDNIFYQRTQTCLYKNLEDFIKFEVFGHFVSNDKDAKNIIKKIVTTSNLLPAKH